MSNDPATLLADEYVQHTRSTMLRYALYVALVLHTGFGITQLLTASLSIGWIAVLVSQTLTVLFLLMVPRLQKHYRTCSLVLLLGLLILFMRQLSPTSEAFNAVLIAPVLPLVTLILLGKRLAWAALAVETLIVFYSATFVDPVRPNGGLGNGGHAWSMQDPHMLSLIVAMIVLVVAQVYVNLNERLRSHLQDFASRDYLTGVLNRHGIDVQLEKAGTEAALQGKPLTVIIADIDLFKDLNDQHGHLVGDWCLEQIGKTLEAEAERLQKSAQVGRYGGEEFIVILPDCRSLDEARALGETLRLAAGAAGSSAVPGQYVRLTMGLAFTQSVSREKNADLLLESADIALYQGKNSGRDKLVAVNI